MGGMGAGPSARARPSTGANLNRSSVVGGVVVWLTSLSGSASTVAPSSDSGGNASALRKQWTKIMETLARLERRLSHQRSLLLKALPSLRVLLCEEPG